MPEARQLWQTALGELQLLMTRANYETWLAHSEGLGFDGEVLRVGVKSPFTQEALAAEPLFRTNGPSSTVPSPRPSPRGRAGSSPQHPTPNTQHPARPPLNP